MLPAGSAPGDGSLLLTVRVWYRARPLEFERVSESGVSTAWRSHWGGHLKHPTPVSPGRLDFEAFDSETEHVLDRDGAGRQVRHPDV